jgi:hypothetical protein
VIPASVMCPSSMTMITSQVQRSASPQMQPQIDRLLLARPCSSSPLEFPAPTMEASSPLPVKKALRHQFLPDFNSGKDRFLREAMFGPENPRQSGRPGLLAGPAGLDTTLPGFGPFGTTGHHCFNTNSPAYRLGRLEDAVTRLSHLSVPTSVLI